MLVLNNGVDFKECSDTSAEMELNENKKTNAGEFAKLFHVSAGTISGESANVNGAAKLAAIPLMQVIQCALDRDFLLEREKGSLYWAFDTKELLKGEQKERFEAYKTALDANFMQIDEVRYAEDLEPLGLTWIKLGLNDVLYDPKTKAIYTPNTNQLTSMSGSALNPAEPDGQAEPGQENADSGTDGGDTSLQNSDNRDNITERAGNYIQDPTTGRMNGSTPSGTAKSTSNSQLTNTGSIGTIQSSQPPNWTTKEQKEPFDYYSLQNDKTGYPRHLKASHFSDEDTLSDHFSRHGTDLNCSSKESYTQNAISFFESPRGKNGDAFVRKNGDACRYDYASKHFVVVTNEGIIKTYWNLGKDYGLKGADNYWEKEKKNGC